MKAISKKIKKTLIIVIISIFIIVAAAILLVSPITKYIIEKSGDKWIGRRITVSWVYANPFSGYIYINNLKIYESKDTADLRSDDNLILSSKGLSANIALRKLLSKNIEITQITLTEPKATVIQKGKIFNFSDIVRKFSSKPTDKKTKSSYHFDLLNFKIINGEVNYNDRLMPVIYSVKDLNIENIGRQAIADSIAVKYSFLSGTGSGSLKGIFSMNYHNMNYLISSVIHNLDAKFIGQYLKDIINYGNYSATLDADMHASGNFDNPDILNAKGKLAINDFHFGKKPGDDYLAFDKLEMKIDDLSPWNHLYLFDSISLTHPVYKYEIYDRGDNLDMMFGRNFSNISSAFEDTEKFNLVLKLAHYIKLIARNFFQSDYKINDVAVKNGSFKFNNFALKEKFSISADPFNIHADSVNKNHKRVAVSLRSGIKPFGNIDLELSINPKDSGEFDLHYNVQKVAVTTFNPYLISYTSFPLDRGTMELKGIWHVRKGNINSENHLILIDPRLTKRIKNDDAKWLPLPLIMSFVRESGNVIDYEIPITGNLKNPSFHLHDVIMDLVKNIFVKPATTPYRKQVKNSENEIEKSLTLKWNMRQSSLIRKQEKFVNRMAEFLKQNPDASIEVYPVHYAEKEKEYLEFFLAKKKYFLNKTHSLKLSESDSLKLEQMSVKDSSFVNYLDKLLNDKMLFTMQEKCRKYLGAEIINAKFNTLNKERKDAFMSQFIKKAVEKRVKLKAAETTVPYNGFSFYKIVYKGDIPNRLIKAYKQMNEFNNEAPRLKFKDERKSVRKETRSGKK